MLTALSSGAYALGTVLLTDTPADQGPDLPAFSAAAGGAQLAGMAPSLDALADFAAPSPTATNPPSPTPSPTEPPPTPTEEPTLVIAEGAEAAELPTETPVPPTETPEPPTPTPEPPTPTPETPTPTPEPPTPTPTPEPPTPTPTLEIPSDIPLLGQFVPTATTVPTATNPPSQARRTKIDPDEPVTGMVTRYADSLEGNSMACGGEFNQDYPFIIAVSLAYDTVWPCGTTLEVCGPAGCLTGLRTDTCPGCPDTDIDMTRAGVQEVCGNQTGCEVVIRKPG